MPPSASALLSYNSVVDANTTCHDTTDPSSITPRSAKEIILEMVDSIERNDLKQLIKVELERFFANNERLLKMLQSKSQTLEQEHGEYKSLAHDYQQRYEKAVREMQFYRQKYEHVLETSDQYQQHQKQKQQEQRIRSFSIDSRSSGEGTDQPPATHQRSANHHKANNSQVQSYPLTPTSPQSTSIIASDMSLFGTGDLLSDFSCTSSMRHKSTSSPSRSSSVSTNTQFSIFPQWNLGSTQLSEKQHTGPSFFDGVSTSLSRLRQNSTATSVHSSTTENSTLTSSSTTSSDNKSSQKKQSWQLLQANPSTGNSVSLAATVSAPPMGSLKKEGVVPSLSSTGHSVSMVDSVQMTPVRSSTATNGYTGASLIQQRRVDPLIFGGSDGLWDTISKSKGSDVMVEKMISNFLRRGGSPNTAKQSTTTNAVKYGFGIIHALIVTKASGSLDLLLQQGANPNAYSLGQVEDDKVTPCYLAASVGWQAGLQKLVQAGGDLMMARGGGVKNKTALHAAAEHCHAAVVEYIVDVTRGRLNLEVDGLGASVLHYACASGHTDLVSFLVKSCKLPVDQEDHRGELPLHWAARHGRLEVVTLLVERCGCNRNAYVPRKVGTPLDLARAGGHRRLVDYLKGSGALSSKKMEKKREEEKSKDVPVHMQSILAMNGLFAADDDDY